MSVPERKFRLTTFNHSIYKMKISSGFPDFSGGKHERKSQASSDRHNHPSILNTDFNPAPFADGTARQTGSYGKGTGSNPGAEEARARGVKSFFRNQTPGHNRR